jgi:hypothetical protein
VVHVRAVYEYHDPFLSVYVVTSFQTCTS